MAMIVHLILNRVWAEMPHPAGSARKAKSAECQNRAHAVYELRCAYSTEVYTVGHKKHTKILLCITS